jgi:hypothetical protein
VEDDGTEREPTPVEQAAIEAAMEQYGIGIETGGEDE